MVLISGVLTRLFPTYQRVFLRKSMMPKDKLIGSGCIVSCPSAWRFGRAQAWIFHLIYLSVGRIIQLLT